MTVIKIIRLTMAMQLLSWGGVAQSVKKVLVAGKGIPIVMLPGGTSRYFSLCATCSSIISNLYGDPDGAF